MKIGILIPGFSANEGDWCIPVYLNLVRELAKKHYVRVFPLRYPFTTKPYTVYNAQVFPLGGGSFSSGVQRWQLLWQAERIIKNHHRSEPFDVLHAIWADEPGYVANRVGQALDIPRVVSIAGGELVGFQNIDYGLQLGTYSSWLVRKAIKHASAVVAPSEYSARLLRHYAKHHRLTNLINGQGLHIIPLGVDTNLFHLPYDVHSNRPREFLHVASLNPVKRQDILLHLLAKMPEVQLDIVGEGKLQDYLERLALDLGVRDRVFFHGAVPHHELPAFYQSSRYLLMTSQHEAFGMAALEAYACGMKIIGTATGIIPEISTLYSHFGKMDDFLSNVIGRQRNFTPERLRQQYDEVERYYSIQRMAERLLKLYENLHQGINLGAESI